VSPADRAKAAHKAAEAAREAGDLTTARALSAAAGAWERVAGPGVEWSTKRLQADLLQLRIDVAIATGPFQPPVPPKAPSPAAVQPERKTATQVSTRAPEYETIQF
jgi:hypothetical protein